MLGQDTRLARILPVNPVLLLLLLLLLLRHDGRGAAATAT